MTKPLHVLAFSGSARRESLNRKLLACAVAGLRSQGAEVTVFDLNERPFPLYHGDLEDDAGLPGNVKALIELIDSHHALLIASPEYNSMPTPLLKNTIDWCTRGDRNPFTGHVVALVSASPGAFGGLRSQIHVRSLLTHLGSHVVPTQCILPHADKAFAPDGTLTSARARESVEKLTEALIDTARKLRAVS